jgi:hypothetical protein
MACTSNTEDEALLMISGITKEEAELAEFKAGVVKSMKQYNAGLVKTFDNVDDLLADLHSPE